MTGCDHSRGVFACSLTYLIRYYTILFRGTVNIYIYIYMFGCWSDRWAWHWYCKRFISNRRDIVSAYSRSRIRYPNTISGCYSDEELLVIEHHSQFWIEESVDPVELPSVHIPPTSFHSEKWIDSSSESVEFRYNCLIIANQYWGSLKCGDVPR